MFDGVGEDGASEHDVLLEPDGHDQERQAFGEQNHGDWNAKLSGDEEAEKEGEDGREEDARGEPKVGAHAAHGEEEGHEGEMHRNVAQSHDDDVESLGILEEVDKLDPGVANPSREAAPRLRSGSLHDPHLLLPPMLRLSRLLQRDIVGNFLGDGEEFGSLAVRDREGQGAVLRVGRDGIRSRGERPDRQILGDGHRVDQGSGLGGVRRERFGEHERQESKVLGRGGDRSVRIVRLPLPSRVFGGTEKPATLDERGPFGFPDTSGGVEQALFEEANVRGASQKGDNNDGMDGVRRGEPRQDLEERRDLLVQP